MSAIRTAIEAGDLDGFAQAFYARQSGETIMVTRASVKSPCIEVCSLNNEDVCIGCYRTANEIIGGFRE